MTAESIILPEADQEIADACHWLERRGFGLGKDFLSCLDAVLATICQGPEGFARAMDDFRHFKVRRVPDTIYSEYTDRVVVVEAVFHGAQAPARRRQALCLRKPE